MSIFLYATLVRKLLDRFLQHFQRTLQRSSILVNIDEREESICKSTPVGQKSLEKTGLRLQRF